jgi:hypothetical protein
MDNDAFNRSFKILVVGCMVIGSVLTLLLLLAVYATLEAC